MVIYPVSGLQFKIPSYRGTKPKLRAKHAEKVQLAIELEEYLNSKFKEEAKEIYVFYYGFIAHDLSRSEEEVRSVLFSLDCGHNGVTICTEDYWNKKIAKVNN